MKNEKRLVQEDRDMMRGMYDLDYRFETYEEARSFAIERCEEDKAGTYLYEITEEGPVKKEVFEPEKREFAVYTDDANGDNDLMDWFKNYEEARSFAIEKCKEDRVKVYLSEVYDADFGDCVEEFGPEEDEDDDDGYWEVFPK